MNETAVAQTKKRNRIISEAMLIALTPLLGNLILTYYYKKIEEYLDVPGTFWSGNLLYSVGIGFGIVILLTAMYWLSEIISRFILTGSGNPLLIRLRRVTQVSLFFTLALLLNSIIGYNDSFFKDLPYALIAFAGVWLIFALREIVFPLVQFRKVKGISKRLARHNPNEFYLTATTYYRSLLKVTSLGLLLIPLLVTRTLIDSIATSHTDMSHPRQYIILDTTPKRIVLVNYGDRWLTAVYDDSYPNKPAYRKDYQIMNSDDFSKAAFHTKTINMLYVYDE